MKTSNRNKMFAVWKEIWTVEQSESNDMQQEIREILTAPSPITRLVVWEICADWNFTRHQVQTLMEGFLRLLATEANVDEVGNTEEIPIKRFGHACVFTHTVNRKQ